ncbi:hypothetical protein EDC94DRAFT_604692 [Helicostylum pulchrum]|nr:hypothetical protein EDC94DRAFT_604692 [Helicostylum pulchrum]
MPMRQRVTIGSLTVLCLASCDNNYVVIESSGYSSSFLFFRYNVTQYIPRTEEVLSQLCTIFRRSEKRKVLKNALLTS